MRPVRARAAQKPSLRQRTAQFDGAVAEFFMQIALDEAARGLGRTSPNPVVGAVLVNNGRIVGRGFHQRAGTAHAEVVAIESAGHRAHGATLYTTLEPCDHYGRTPPCSLAILRAGIRRVVTASADPNPLVNGRGIARLRKGGVEVETGVLREAADRLNRPFFKRVTQGLPFVTLKAAITLDGKIATATGDSKWITGESARERVHRLRDQVDVVLVGASTVERDDPKLTTRLPGSAGRDAARLVVDSRLRLSPDREIFQQHSNAKTVVATLARDDSKRAQRIAATGAEVWTLPARAGRVALKPLLKRVAKAGWNHVLVEGGAELFTELLKQQLVDELWLFVAPKLAGADGVGWVGELGLRKMSGALSLPAPQIEAVDDDVLLRFQLAGLAKRRSRLRRKRE